MPLFFSGLFPVHLTEPGTKRCSVCDVVAHGLAALSFAADSAGLLFAISSTACVTRQEQGG